MAFTPLLALVKMTVGSIPRDFYSRKRQVQEFIGTHIFPDTYRATLTIIIVILITSICDLMVSVLLVMAAYTERPNLAKPWLVVSMISLSIDVILFISALAVGDLRVAITTPIRIGDKPSATSFLYAES